MKRSEPRDATAFEVRDALREPGCAICALAVRSVHRLIRSIAYEQVNDLALRKQLRTAGGFCNAHAHQWLREARSVLGTALIYRDVITAALRDLQGGAAQDSQRGGLLRGLFGMTDRATVEAACPGCQAQFEAEARYVEALVVLVADQSQALEGSASACRRHTAAAVRLGGPAALRSPCACSPGSAGDARCPAPPAATRRQPAAPPRRRRPPRPILATKSGPDVRG